VKRILKKKLVILVFYYNIMHLLQLYKDGRKNELQYMMILLKAWVCGNGSILQQLLYLVYSLLISLTVESPIFKCYAVYANIQGSKNPQCLFYHRVINSNQRKKGKIVQLECHCIFHYY